MNDKIAFQVSSEKYGESSIIVVVKRELWNRWIEYCGTVPVDAQQRHYWWDFPECEECGVISIRHLSHLYKFEMWEHPNCDTNFVV